MCSVLHTKTGGPGVNMDLAVGSVPLWEKISGCFLWETNNQRKPAPPSLSKSLLSEGGRLPVRGMRPGSIDPLRLLFPCLQGLWLLRLGTLRAGECVYSFEA